MITGKISLIKNKEKEIAFPVTSAEAVYMPDGKTTVNEQLETNANNAIGVSVKNFGAVGDGITDDTQAIKNALNSNENIITMDCDCKISSSLNLPIDKKYIFNGSFIIDDDFIGENVISISGLRTALEINKISIIHSKFYKQDRHLVENTVRTNFDGLVINDCRRLNINEVEIVGITSRALVRNGGYEIILGKVDLWGSNLTDEYSLLNDQDDKLNFSKQGERYTIGFVDNGNDSFYSNVTSVGFNIGITTNSCNAFTNIHPWGYKSSMIYGMVTKGSYNMCNNLYLDTIKTITERTGAGIYECKLSDVTNVTNMSIERNKYSNVTALSIDNTSCIVELGDSDKAQTSYMTSVINVSGEYGTKMYKLNGTAKGSPLLDNKIGTNIKSYNVSISSLIFDQTETLTNIIKEIIINHLETYFIGFSSSLLFTDNNKLITSKLPDTSALKNQKATIKIENYNANNYRCSIMGNGYPNSETYIIDVYRNDSNIFEYYHHTLSPTKNYTYFPNANDYSVGCMMFYKNKPIWKSSEGYWVDATGSQVFA